MTETTKSVMDYVKDFAAVNPTFTAEAIRATYPDKPANQLATALWKLRNKGVISKNDATGVYTVLTGVNALPTEAKPQVKAKVTRKNKPRAKPKAVAKPTTEDTLAKKLHVAERDAKYWQERSEMHMNALTALRQQAVRCVAVGSQKWRQLLSPKSRRRWSMCSNSTGPTSSTR